ncbi:MAG: hypothetical protein IPH24_12470 [Crocinitomicaceae bacterium]|nr:hypothetical protein [Crocinitomicaceae bacterium]
MRVLVIVFVLFSGIAQAQVSGPLADSGRKVLSDFDFKITWHKSGTLVFDISVNPAGLVKLCVLNTAQSSIVSTPLMMKAKNHILTNLKFESGSGYADLQSGTVTIQVVIQS